MSWIYLLIWIFRTSFFNLLQPEQPEWTLFDLASTSSFFFFFEIIVLFYMSLHSIHHTYTCQFNRENMHLSYLSLFASRA